MSHSSVDRLRRAKGNSPRRCAWLKQFTAPAFGGAPTPPCSALGLKLIVHRPRGLVLFGATRLGKTVWARSLGPHAYFGGLFNLSDYSDDAEYAVFDDISGGFGFFPSYKQWLGGQFTFTVTDKYKHKVTLRWGKPTIWLCNTDPRLDWYKPGASPDFEWMEANCDFVEIHEPIFHASTE